MGSSPFSWPFELILGSGSPEMPGRATMVELLTVGGAVWPRGHPW
ncbi:hypothetical protein [Nocardiopsis xinjiangensis]|nr:hypothetical protein [Nocardiopsis xinjiangensis]